MKKLMKKSSDSYDPAMSMSMSQSAPPTTDLLYASADATPTAEFRTYTESEHIGEQIKVEFKKALTNRRPST